MPDAPEDPHLGRALGGYRIEERIGRGGMGVVYRGEHLRLGRRAAIKIIAPELATSAGFRERFSREARIAASLHHPNVVAVYDAGELGDLLWIAMQYVEGSDLGAILRGEGRLGPYRAIDVCRQMADALDAAHAIGLIHRDVKPANVLVEGRHAYLTDFGLTKRLEAASTMLTKAGDVVGTIHYCAPEQIEGREVDARADVYALGCLLYHCLAGVVPYPQDSDVAVIYAHLEGRAPRLSEVRADLPRGLDHVIARALEKSPDRRFQSCHDLMEAARAVVEESSPLAPESIPSGRFLEREGEPPSVAAAVADAGPGGDRPSATVRTGSAAAGEALEDGPRPRVLLAALDPTSRAVTRVALGSAVEVEEAAEPAAVVEAAQWLRPDVVVLDWNAPGGSGRDMMRALRGDAPTRETKVLLVVDWDNSDRGEVAAAGAAGTLGAPFSPLQLQAQLRKLLGRDALSG
jgi:CheY-like chemotaxis protein/predicted Ser/Thr protein kinase